MTECKSAQSRQTRTRKIPRRPCCCVNSMTGPPSNGDDDLGWGKGEKEKGIATRMYHASDLRSEISDDFRAYPSQIRYSCPENTKRWERASSRKRDGQESGILGGREPDVSPFVGGSESRLRAKWCDGRRSGQFLVFVFLFLQPLPFFLPSYFLPARSMGPFFPEERERDRESHRAVKYHDWGGRGMRYCVRDRKCFNARCRPRAYPRV